MADPREPVRKALPVTAETTADDREIRVICSTADTDRAGEVIVQGGINLDAYRKNPVVLWQHDPREPVARATSIKVEGGRLVATVRFAPPGVSDEADKVRGLVKAGIINAVSVGIDPIEVEPLPVGDGQRGAPMRYVRCELLEFSFVSIPANRSALVVERSGSPPAGASAAARARMLAEVAALARPPEQKATPRPVAPLPKGRAARLAALDEFLARQERELSRPLMPRRPT